MASMLVVGIGRFGKHLATKLVELGNEVMVVDKNEALVEHIAPYVTNALVGDCMDEEVIASLGVSNFDVCFVCISDNFQSSLEVTSLLKEAGAAKVVSKTDREMHAKFLLKIGADAVIHPERDMAWRTAMRFSTAGAFDYIELSKDYAIVEMTPPLSWIGKSLSDLKVRTRFGVNIIGIKDASGHVRPIVDAAHVFHTDEHMLIAGNQADVARLTKK
ncbi:MAG: TrkA family potassium uptake protein [Clostridia bacterium]